MSAATSTPLRLALAGNPNCGKTALFNLLTGYSEVPNWRKLAVAPVGLRERVLELVEREAQLARDGKGGQIIAQMNSLVDPEVIAALYRASQAGVKIELIVRGICCLRAGVPGVSENIRVISIIGRYLEHCRIMYFRNGSAEEVYLTSGDWMPRNLDRRVEIAFPVEQENLKQRLTEMLDMFLSDNVKARIMQPDGTYQYSARAIDGAKPPLSAQEWFMQEALRAVEEYEDNLP